MGDLREPDELELAALMCSKLCHDVIGPIGAIGNGFELIDDLGGDPDPEALSHVRRNADKASRRIQYARLAFGAMGAAGDQFPVDEARRLTVQFFEDEKQTVVWEPTGQALPKDEVRLLVNLVAIAAAAIPRGGEVTVNIEADGERTGFRLVAAGPRGSVVPAAPSALFAGEAPPEGRIDAYNVQVYYATRLAKAVDMRLSFVPGEGQTELHAVPLPAETDASEETPGD
ncbi:histidine phosphotransferase family protein [Lutibaculum baratangense]|uniref:Histidine phosphotransferase ChpT C-terminal domain-containing protein n=1 Tax=Lutibaculum baratangense AMV1 TaxID=631454 RepID=V4RB77_9HYPH|nr:histidine phosphotransferase family protein [Lutibaculum baratangense]ESR22664.1 hypothetical protein N177_3801 [Lutibaculum baratangense AMV1]